MLTNSYYKLLIFSSLTMIGLFLSGCQAGRISTAITLSEDIPMEVDDQVKNNIESYFEKESYTNEEMDEMFYVVENHSEQIIEVSEFYFVQKWMEDEWKTLDNNTINQIDRTVRILPGASAEFVFWLSMDSSDFDKGTYRLNTRMTVHEETEDDQDGEPLNVFIPFEINQ